MLWHLQSIGFVINREKSMLSSTQEVSFLALSLNTVTFRACLSEDRVASVGTSTSHTRRFRLGEMVRGCGSPSPQANDAIHVVHLGHLHMREFHFWVASPHAATKALQ